MERVLLWHPDFPHTRDNPISRTRKRAVHLAGKGWQEWPPPSSPAPGFVPDTDQEEE